MVRCVAKACHVQLVLPISAVLLCVGHAAILASPLPPSAEAETKPDSLTARQVLDRTAAAYKECKSYSDSSVVKTVFFTNEEGRTHSDEKPFKSL